ncbi:phage baseplate protein, partial [Acinetobacter baumannii]
MAETAIIRTIGGYVAEVTVREQHSDDLTITTHPVERGAPVTDHAFKMPAQLTIEAGWSAAGAYRQAN